jgi:hypothetical protein
LRTAREAVLAANPAAKVESREVDVYPLTVTVAKVLRQGRSFFFLPTMILSTI